MSISSLRDTGAGKSPSPTIMDHPQGNGQQPVITSPQPESQRVTENDNIQSGRFQSKSTFL